MLVLFRRASFLFWQYPVLWLPVAIADIAVFFVNQLQEKLTHTIITRITTSDSVLSTSHEPINSALTNAQTVELLLFTKPIGWSAYLLDLFAYLSAMIAVFTLIQLLSSKLNLTIYAIVSSIQQSCSRILILSLKLLIAIEISSLLFFLLLTLFLTTHGTKVISANNFSYACATLWLTGIAYVMSTDALGLLRPQGLGSLTEESVHQARISGVLTVLSSAALYLLVAQTKSTFLARSTHFIGVLLFELVASLISASPYIVLFIALSILARGADEHNAELPGAELESI